jgi:TP901-1 family phage major tail protein
MAMNGTDVLLLVNTGTPIVPVYTAVGSQRDVTFDEATAEIDVSSKDAREQEVLPGRYTANLTLDHLYVEDDAGYEALKDAMRDGELILVAKQVDEVTTETASALVTSLSERYPDQGEATVSCSLTISGGWTEETS